MDKIGAIVQRLVHFYSAYVDDKSKMYGLLKAFADEFDIVVNDYINRSDNDIGIMTTDVRDLEWRWGSMMGFPRLGNESYERYRMRLANMVNALRGGTAPAIQYAVALMLGVDDDQEVMDKHIHIIDAWKYADVPDEYNTFGNFIVEITFQAEEFNDKYFNGVSADDINEIVHIVKAAGTNGIIMFLVHLHDEHIKIKQSTGYIIYTPRLSGTYPYRSKIGEWDKNNIVIYTHNDGIGYRNPYIGEINAGTYPQPARYGEISRHDMDIGVDGHGIGYRDPYTGEIVSGVFPDISKIGDKHNVGIGVKMSVNSGRYTSPIVGTRPQHARYGEIVDGVMTVKILADGAEYTTPQSGIQPDTSRYGEIDTSGVVIESYGVNTNYAVHSAGEINTGSTPDIAVEGAIESGGIEASTSGDGASYGAKMCGTTLGNLF